MEPQAETILWQRLIDAETAIEKLNKAELRNDAVYLEKMILDLQDRVKILEEARQRQIALNKELLEKRAEKPELKPESKPKSFWDLFKK